MLGRRTPGATPTPPDIDAQNRATSMQRQERHARWWWIGLADEGGWQLRLLADCARCPVDCAVPGRIAYDQAAGANIGAPWGASASAPGQKRGVWIVDVL